ncbi:MAG: hypothetical protein HY654_04330 [Acidobacteria bacterium]|nr:hypothetical protein [Acidobacteriota bacterium]
MSTTPWFRVSVSASRTLLASSSPLCQGLASYAGFGPPEASEVGAQLQDALRKAIGKGRDAAEPVVDIICRTDRGRFEARVSRDGRAVETIVRPLLKSPPNAPPRDASL